MAGGMTVTAWAICAAVAGALCFAVAAALQQQEASAAPATRVAGWRLLVHLVRRPRWVLGMVAMLLGGGLHLLALRSGPLVLVQPLGVSAVLFALPLAAALRGTGFAPGSWPPAHWSWSAWEGCCSSLPGSHHCPLMRPTRSSW
jgi:hypothetical protein